MNIQERIRRAQYVLSYLPYSPCGVTAELLRMDLGIPVDALQEPFEDLINDVRTRLRIVVCEEPLEARGQAGHNEPEYWVAPGKLNRARATAICASVLNCEEDPNFRVPKLWDPELPDNPLDTSV